MSSTFTAIIQKGEKYFIAYSPEIPGANGQGLTKEEALDSLKSAITLILEDRREEYMKDLPDSAIKESVTVE